MAVHELTAEAVEKSLIGALVFDRDAIAAVSDRITPEAFATPKWRAIYRAVQRCWEKRIPPDITTVHLEMANDPLYASEADWMAGVADLSEALLYVGEYGWFTHAPHYADAVVAFAQRRAVSDAGAKIVQMAHDGGDLDPDLAIHQALADIHRFGATTERRGPMTYDEIIPDYQDRIMRMRSGEIPNRVTGTGFKYLDKKLTGGFYPGELVILAARPSMGKTAFALQLAHNVARGKGDKTTGIKPGDPKHVLVFSAEMSKESLLKRAVSEISGQAADKSEYDLNDQEFDQYLQSLERLRGLPVSIDDTPGITIAQMTVRVQAEQRKHNVGLVIFDYIELAGDSVGKEGEERRIDKIVKGLKTMARTLDVTVVALCQLNRQVENRANKRPMLADLRFSGSIEQDADKVLFLYRHDYYVNQGTAQPEEGTEGTAEVIVSKHRNGPVGEVRLHFRGETMRFFDMEITSTFRPNNTAA